VTGGVRSPTAICHLRPNGVIQVHHTVWNLLGLADIVVAVTTGFLSSPSPIQLFAFDNPNTLIMAFPLVMIPVFRQTRCLVVPA
jgi:hypothetical protein